MARLGPQGNADRRGVGRHWRVGMLRRPAGAGALGISGAWIGSLTALEPYRPALIGLTLLFLGLAFRKLLSDAADPSTGNVLRSTGSNRLE